MLDRREFLLGVAAGGLGAALAGALPALGQEGGERKDGSGGAQLPPGAKKDSGGKGGGGADIAEPQRVDVLDVQPLKEALRRSREGGISFGTLEAHHKIYAVSVAQANALAKKVAAGGLEGAALREAKIGLALELNAVKSHEIYFSILGGDGGAPERRLLKYLERDFGGLDRWKQDLKATALAAKAWVWLAFDFMTNRLTNFLGDGEHQYPVWDASPVLALDMGEHAYAADFKADKGAYVDAFLAWLDWKHVADRLDVELKCANLPGVD